MAKTHSARKAHRASLRRRVFNARRKAALKAAVKDTLAAAARKEGKEASMLLPKAYQAIDKAVKSGVIKKNTAARMKSRLAAKVKAAL